VVLVGDLLQKKVICDEKNWGKCCELYKLLQLNRLGLAPAGGFGRSLDPALLVAGTGRYNLDLAKTGHV